MELEQYRIYSEMARGIRKAPLVLKNANIFYAHSGEFRKGDVAVADGLVLGTGSYSGERETDLSGSISARALLTVTFIWNLLL